MMFRVILADDDEQLPKRMRAWGGLRAVLWGGGLAMQMGMNIGCHHKGDKGDHDAER